MINFRKFYKTRTLRAQGMVEFALVLPILLLILYGTLETGRLLFIYGSAVTAARQAVRYGSATGEGPNGIYYNDCAGIQDAARKVGFINTFDTIDISFDGGVDADGNVKDIDGDNGNGLTLPCPAPAGTFGNGDRIIVSVTTQWAPILSLVPLPPFTVSAESERTILVDVPIITESDPSFFDPTVAAACIKLNSITAPNFSSTGSLAFTYGIKNIGTADGSPTIIDSFSGFKDVTTSCPALAMNTTGTCSGTYSVIQSDLDAGIIQTKAYASPLCASLSMLSNTKIGITYANQLPAISLSITPSTYATTKVGTIITYKYYIKNTGNVTLSGPFSVKDDKVGSVDCSGAISIKPGETTSCTADYKVVQKDIDDQEIVNPATASTTFTYKPARVINPTTTVQASASATVYTSSIYLVVSSSVPAATAPGQVITYTYTINNISAAPVASPSVTDNKGSVSCPGATIAVDDKAVCTRTYTVTTTDMDSGIAIQNTARASGILSGSTVQSNTVNFAIPITQSPAISVAVVGTPNTNPIVKGSTVSYQYTITNSGNVTLKSPFAITTAITTITPPPTSTLNCTDQSDLAAGASRLCTTSSYPVLVADMTAGSIINSTTATATFNSATVTSAAATDTQITFAGPRFQVRVEQNKSLVTASNEQITYTYYFYNTGGVTLDSPYTITSSLGSAYPSSTLNCVGQPLSFEPGDTVSCKNTYTVESSGTITNTVTAATVAYAGSPISATNTPQSVTATAYICTNTNLVFSESSSVSQHGDEYVTWTITNTVGTPLPISSIVISWDRSGDRAGDFHLDEVTVTNSTVSQSTLPALSSSYVSGSGTLNTGVTTILMHFSKKGPTGVSLAVTFGSPYGTCHLP